MLKLITSNPGHLLRRLAEETERAKSASLPARRAHQQMAQMYAEQLAALKERGLAWRENN